MSGIFTDDDSVPWAAAGTSVTLYLTAIDPIHLNIGSILCPPTDVVPLVSTFTARIIVFDIQTPITTGASVSNNTSALLEETDNQAQIELFHHSYDVPATLTKLIASLDRASGKVIKANPRSVAFTYAKHHWRSFTLFFEWLEFSPNPCPLKFK